MSIYYVAEVLNEGSILLKTALEKQSKIVSLDELDNSKETIIGYNKVTKQISRKDLSDLQKYLISKVRLTGYDILSEDMYRITNAVYKEKGNTLAITIKDNAVVVDNKFVELGYRFNEIYRTLCIDWKAIFSNIERSIKESKSIFLYNIYHTYTDIEITLDTQAYTEFTGIRVDGFMNYRTTLSKLDLVNKNMFENATSITNLFNFDLRLNKVRYNLATEQGVEKAFENTILNLKDIPFNPHVKIDNMFSPSLNIVNYPDSILNKEQGVLHDRCTYTFEEYKYLRKKYSGYVGELSDLFNNITISELSYEHAMEYSTTNEFLRGVKKINTLVLDTDIDLYDRYLFDKSNNMSQPTIEIGKFHITPDFEINISEFLRNNLVALAKGFSKECDEDHIETARTMTSMIHSLLDVAEESYFEHMMLQGKIACSSKEELTALFRIQRSLTEDSRQYNEIQDFKEKFKGIRVVGEDISYDLPRDKEDLLLFSFMMDMKSANFYIDNIDSISTYTKGLI